MGNPSTILLSRVSLHYVKSWGIHLLCKVIGYPFAMLKDGEYIYSAWQSSIPPPCWKMENPSTVHRNRVSLRHIQRWGIHLQCLTVEYFFVMLTDGESIYTALVWRIVSLRHINRWGIHLQCMTVEYQSTMLTAGVSIYNSSQSSIHPPFWQMGNPSTVVYGRVSIRHVERWGIHLLCVHPPELFITQDIK